ncbi:MAG: hypothetical protein IT375_16735 [Polyangiaceae bacterium]|nr:hypothetical protein [Polyangiaceae bacterium]MCK6536000.1 hypothetical protein [Polyangiaceae bacterium]
MGRFDRRKSMKMRRKKAQVALKARVKRKAETKKAAKAATPAPKKKKAAS